MRLVADCCLIPEPVENIYSGVVSFRHLRLVIFLGELNNLELWGGDIGNAYLEAYTHEKLFIIAGAEFEELEGFILIFNKALIGLKSSGKRLAERFYDIINDIGFKPAKADPCTWMRENKNLKCYEYLATHVDDLCIAAQDPGKIIQTLRENYKLKVKGDEPLSHPLGADYTRDKDNTLVCQPKKYIDRLVESYDSMFNQDPPKNMRTPLDKNHSPELDGTELLTGEFIQHYLTIIGKLQWVVTLGRFDIHAQITTMSRFRSAPRKGHLERLQRVYGYVLKTKHYLTRYRTEEPDYSYLPNMEYDWSNHPQQLSQTSWKSVTTTTTLDANLLHCLATVIQFPPEMDENWVRYGLAKLGQISRLPNWQRMVFCVYTTQLLHSTGEVCWNNKDSYFIWFEFVCRNSGQIASRRSWKRSCLGLEYTSKCSRLALLWEPN